MELHNLKVSCDQLEIIIISCLKMNCVFLGKIISYIKLLYYVW